MGAREYMFILLKARHYMLLRRGVSVGGVTSDYCGKNQKNYNDCMQKGDPMGAYLGAKASDVFLGTCYKSDSRRRHTHILHA